MPLQFGATQLSVLSNEDLIIDAPPPANRLERNVCCAAQFCRAEVEGVGRGWDRAFVAASLRAFGFAVPLLHSFRWRPPYQQSYYRYHHIHPIDRDAYDAIGPAASDGI